MTPEEINAKALECALKHFLDKYQYKESKKREEESLPEAEMRAIRWFACHYREFITDTSWTKEKEEIEKVTCV